MKSPKIIPFLFTTSILITCCFAENSETNEKLIPTLSQLELLKTKFIFLKEVLTYPFSGKLPKINEILPDEHSMRLCQQLQQKILNFTTETSQNKNEIPATSTKAVQNENETPATSIKTTQNENETSATQKFADFFIREFQNLLPHFGDRADELFFELEESLYQRNITEIKAIYTAIGDKTPLYPLPKLHIMFHIQEKIKDFSDSDFIKLLTKPAASLTAEWNHAAGLWFLHGGDFEKAVTHLNNIPWRHKLEPWYEARIMHHTEEKKFTEAEKAIIELERKFPEADTNSFRTNIAPANGENP